MDHLERMKIQRAMTRDNRCIQQTQQDAHSITQNYYHHQYHHREFIISNLVSDESAISLYFHARPATQIAFDLQHQLV
jgi:hypothetical protein